MSLCFSNLRYLPTWGNSMNMGAFVVKTQCSIFKSDCTKWALWWGKRSMNNAEMSASEWQQRSSLVNVNASQGVLTPVAWLLPGSCNTFAASCVLWCQLVPVEEQWGEMCSLQEPLTVKLNTSQHADIYQIGMDQVKLLVFWFLLSVFTFSLSFFRLKWLISSSVGSWQRDECTKSSQLKQSRVSFSCFLFFFVSCCEAFRAPVWEKLTTIIEMFELKARLLFWSGKTVTMFQFLK